MATTDTTQRMGNPYRAIDEAKTAEELSSAASLIVNTTKADFRHRDAEYLRKVASTVGKLGETWGRWAGAQKLAEIIEDEPKSEDIEPTTDVIHHNPAEPSVEIVDPVPQSKAHPGHETNIEADIVREMLAQRGGLKHKKHAALKLSSIGTVPPQAPTVPARAPALMAPTIPAGDDPGSAKTAEHIEALTYLASLPGGRELIKEAMDLGRDMARLAIQQNPGLLKESLQVSGVNLAGEAATAKDALRALSQKQFTDAAAKAAVGGGAGYFAGRFMGKNKEEKESYGKAGLMAGLGLGAAKSMADTSRLKDVLNESRLAELSGGNNIFSLQKKMSPYQLERGAAATRAKLTTPRPSGTEKTSAVPEGLPIGRMLGYGLVGAGTANLLTDKDNKNQKRNTAMGFLSGVGGGYWHGQHLANQRAGAAAPQGGVAETPALGTARGPAARPSAFKGYSNAQNSLAESILAKHPNAGPGDVTALQNHPDWGSVPFHDRAGLLHGAAAKTAHPLVDHIKPYDDVGKASVHTVNHLIGRGAINMEPDPVIVRNQVSKLSKHPSFRAMYPGMSDAAYENLASDHIAHAARERGSSPESASAWHNAAQQHLQTIHGQEAWGRGEEELNQLASGSQALDAVRSRE